MQSTLVLGFDGGGTQTRAMLVAGDGSVLGCGRAGASNVNSIGLANAVEQVHVAAMGAWSEAGQSKRAVNAAFLGIAGIKASGQQLSFEEQLSEIGLVQSKHCVVRSDSEAALAGGLAGRPGIVLIAGTGSFCQGRDGHGKTAHCGGWGWLLDDVGSGLFLGREALKAVTRAADGRGETTSLTARVLTAAGMSSVEGLSRWVHNRPSYPEFFSGLARIVTEEATLGDSMANAILGEGAKGLADLVRQVAIRLTWDGVVEVVVVGGVGRSGAPYQPLIETAVCSAVPSAHICVPELPPVAGSVLRALEISGTEITPDLISRLRRGCAQRRDML